MKIRNFNGSESIVMNLSLGFLERQFQHTKQPLNTGPAYPGFVLHLQREGRMEDWGIMNECVVARQEKWLKST